MPHNLKSLAQTVIRGTSPACPGSEDKLSLDEVLYYGFGGYTVYKNSKVFYEGDPNGEWQSFKTLKQIERQVVKSPRAKWKVVLNNPLRGATWTRKGKNNWVLTGTNIGFA